MNLYKTSIFSLIIIIFLSGGSLYAEKCRHRVDKSQNDLLDRKYIDLKKQIISYLSRSWCTTEKISLLMDLILAQKPAVCVEVGVFEGASLLPIAATLKYIGSGKIYAIDPWSNAEAVKNLSDTDVNKQWWQNVDMKAVYKNFCSSIQRFRLKDYVQVISKPSQVAVSEIGAIDFLHLDGNNSREGSLQDVLLYVPKVKKGGHIFYSGLFHCADNQHPRKEAFLP